MLPEGTSPWTGRPRRPEGTYSDVVGVDEHRAHYDPNDGKTAKQLAAERRTREAAIKAAPEYFVPRERLVGRALVILDAGPLTGSDFVARLGPVDLDQLEALQPFVEARRVVSGGDLVDHIVYSVRESSGPIEDLRARLLGRTAA